MSGILTPFKRESLRAISSRVEYAIKLNNKETEYESLSIWQ